MLPGQVMVACKELKTPVITQTFTELADRAREQGWTYEEYLAAAPGRQVVRRMANGTRLRIAGAHFPQAKTLADFDTAVLPAPTQELIAHLATTTFVARAESVVMLGPPGVGKTHLLPGGVRLGDRVDSQAGGRSSDRQVGQGAQAAASPPTHHPR